MAKILFVCGRFDYDGGKPSGYMRQIALDLGQDVDVVNGGYFTDLDGLVDRAAQGGYIGLWWMPEIDNSLPKLVGSIKDRVPRCVLAISKNNSQGKYAHVDLVARMLKARANLALIIDTPVPFAASVIDPLGNAFAHEEGSVLTVARVLYRRTMDLAGFTRVGSTQVGPAIPAPENSDTERFFAAIRGYAGTFHEMVHGVNPSRFLGNASFRCTKGGFPAFRHEDLIFVSRRNIDKRDISVDGFVAIDAQGTHGIRYYGEAKPSVDAPIQRALFQALPWVNFMLHAHVYLEGAPSTDTLVPCGALEEIPEVLKYCGKSGPAFVNLTGHGCLALAESADQLERLRFVARAIPELHEV